MDSLLLNGQSDSLAGVSVHPRLVPPDQQSQLPLNKLPVGVEPCSESRAINQRGCVATGSLDDSCDDQQPSLPQSGLPAEDNDEGQWQVVSFSYRNDRRKRDRHNKYQGIKKVVHSDTCCAVSTAAAASSSAFSAQASSELTAGRCSLAGNRPFRLAANVTDSQCQGCLRSFDYLGKISGLVFYGIMRRHQKYVQQSGQPGAFVHVSKREFARFQRMMVAGPESITQVQDSDCFEGALGHIVNAMKFSGLKFQHFVAQTSVLSFLVKQGSSIKSWQHFSDLLHLRHKAGLTDAGILDTVVRAVEDSGTIFVKVVQTARS